MEIETSKIIKFKIQRIKQKGIRKTQTISMILILLGVVLLLIFGLLNTEPLSIVFFAFDSQASVAMVRSWIPISGIVLLIIGSYLFRTYHSIKFGQDRLVLLSDFSFLNESILFSDITGANNLNSKRGVIETKDQYILISGKEKSNIIGHISERREKSWLLTLP